MNMKNLIYLFLLIFSSSNILGQFQSNNFETEYTLEVQIGKHSLDSIWQIVVPQKTFFDAANSFPNAMVTDTINPYASNLNSTFVVTLNEEMMAGYPFLLLEWMQKVDCEDGVDGGVIEASYDNGQTWLNVFNDPTFRPDIVGSYSLDTLHTGQVGITGTSDWEWMALCWGTFSGTPPEMPSEIQIRFSMVTDSVDTQQEGWMLDNFISYDGVIGSSVDLANTDVITIFPNPAVDQLTMDLSEVEGRDATVEIYDGSGQRFYTKNIKTNQTEIISIDLHQLNSGLYFILVKTKDSQFSSRFYKLE